MRPTLVPRSFPRLSAFAQMWGRAGASLVICLVAAQATPASAQEAPAAVDKGTSNGGASRWEWRDGERVVFLGNTLIEREQKWSQWEAVLAARSAGRNVTFRNLGWDGDTVWADSRGIFDPPAAGYARMLDMVKVQKPTTVILGYGLNEAFAGKDGLDPFVRQYEKLLDDLTKVSAEGVRFVLIAPPPLPTKPAPLPDPAEANASIALYQSAILDLAARRAATTRAVTLFDLSPGTDGASMLSRGSDLSGKLTSEGYAATATRLSELFDAPEGDVAEGSGGPLIVLASDGAVKDHRGFRPFTAEKTDAGIRFEATRVSLAGPAPRIVIEGLPEGRYELRVDGEPVGVAAVRVVAALEWDGSKGKSGFDKHPDVAAFETLRLAIVAKNELSFHAWRPQNVTYLFGFRKHEQGQNAKETAEFEKLVAAKEAEILKLKTPVSRKYELVRK